MLHGEAMTLRKPRRLLRTVRLRCCDGRVKLSRFTCGQFAPDPGLSCPTAVTTSFAPLISPLRSGLPSGSETFKYQSELFCLRNGA